MSDLPQATARAGIGATLMNSPPVDQRMAAPATASTARRMSLPPETACASPFTSAPSYKGARVIAPRNVGSGDGTEYHPPPLGGGQQQERIVHAVLRHAPALVA